MQNADQYWFWMKNVVMQELRAQRDYNNDPPYGLKGFLNDRASRIMGYAVIRQIRNRKYTCKAPYPFDIYWDNHYCSGSRGIDIEETRNYCSGWLINGTIGTSPASCSFGEFTYKTEEEVKTFSYTGRLSYYSGGGYLFRLSGPQSEVIKRMDQLQQANWIDKQTRAVILEFSVYNPNINLFAVCTITAEFNEGGGIMPKWRVDPISLIKGTDFSDFVMYACEVIFAVVTIINSLRELWEIKKQKCNYFVNYWNLAEICILLVSYLTIGAYFYKEILTQEALNVFNETYGNGYVRMDYAANMQQYYVILIAFICFFSTIKLIKLLQFNNRMNVLALTIKGCWDDLSIFFITFFIIFFAFTVLFWLMFSRYLLDFATLYRAFETSFKMMLGKFDYESMKAANPISPVLFFVFSVSNSMILINMMLTIIIQAFDAIKKDLQNKENKYDVIDFVWTKFKHLTRQQKRPYNGVNPNKKSRRFNELHKPNKLSDKVIFFLLQTIFMIFN